MDLNWLLRTGVISTALVLAGCGGGGGSDAGGQTPGSGDVLPNPNPDPTPTPTPTPDPDPAPNPCGGLISQCLDVGSPAITKYKGNSFAAASYTFDDGPATSFDIANIFEERGLPATFYIIPEKVINNNEWDQWRNLLEKGHEIGNHSLTHTVDMGPPEVNAGPPVVKEWSGGRHDNQGNWVAQVNWATSEQLESEINESYRILSRELGTRIMTFAFPWHNWTNQGFPSSNPEWEIQSWEMALENHFDVRSRAREEYVFSFFDNDHKETEPEALTHAKNELTRAVNRGYWFVAAGHGIVGEGVVTDGSWSPISKNFLYAHLDHAQSFQDLWIDTYLNVSRYRHCSSLLTPKVNRESGNRISLSLSGNLSAKNKAVCTEPLTVALKLTSGNLQGLTAQDESENGKDLSTQQKNGLLLVDVKPGQTITLQVPR